MAVYRVFIIGAHGVWVSLPVLLVVREYLITKVIGAVKAKSPMRGSETYSILTVPIENQERHFPFRISGVLSTSGFSSVHQPVPIREDSVRHGLSPWV
jgi:hypothetical protein